METTKFLLKTPILRDLQSDSTGNSFLVDKVQEYKVGPRKETLNLGITTFITYILCFFIMYFTANINCDKTGLFKNWGTNSKGYTNPAYNPCSDSIGLGPGKSITLSYNLLYSHRYLSTILILISCITMSVMFIRQNFGVFDENDGRVFCVIGPFILGFLLSSLLLFGPKEHSDFHFAAAGLIILFGTLFCGISYSLYTQAYTETETETETKEWGTFDDLKYTLIVVVLTAVLSFVGAGFMWYLKHNKHLSNFNLKVSIVDKILGTTELLNLLSIGVYILLVSMKPPLLVNNFCIASI